MEKTQMHGAKGSRNLIMKLPNAHSRVVIKSLTKQKLFQEVEKEKHCHTAPVAHKPASME